MNLPLTIAGVFLFDDTCDFAGSIAQDPAVTVGPVERRREQCHRGLPAAMLRNHGAQRFFFDQRHIAAQNQHFTGKAVKDILGTEYGVAGSQLFFLNRPSDRNTIISVAYRLGAMTDDNRDTAGKSRCAMARAWRKSGRPAIGWSTLGERISSAYPVQPPKE